MPRADAEHTGVILPPPVIYASAFLLALLLNWAWPWPLSDQAVTGVRWFGGLLVALGIAFNAWGVWTLHRHRTAIHPTHSASALVTSGPFRLSRNPLYVGLDVVFVGLVLLANTAWGFVVLVPLLAVMHYGVIRQEELHLEARFGEAFRDYRKRVRRYI